MSTHLDLRGLRCPLPVLRLEAFMRRMAPGEAVIVRADDPLAKIDLPHAAADAGFFCKALEAGEKDDFVFEVTAPNS
jgi:tRNA 2-thiouridine synthesizing protein A